MLKRRVACGQAFRASNRVYPAGRSVVDDEVVDEGDEGAEGAEQTVTETVPRSCAQSGRSAQTCGRPISTRGTSGERDAEEQDDGLVGPRDQT